MFVPCSAPFTSTVVIEVFRTAELRSANMTLSILAQVEASRLATGLMRLGIAAVPSRRASVHKRLQELAEVIERDQLLRPAAACQVLPFSCSEIGRCEIAGRALSGAALDRLAGATEVAVVFATIGARWSEATSACFQRGDALGGYLLDEIGTAVLERLTRRLEAMVRIDARSRGRCAGSPIEPGHPGLPLSLQPVLAELAKVETAGIRVTSSGMISPPKSISMLIGIGQGLRRWTRAQACRECPSFVNCRRQGRRSENGL